MSVSLHAMSCGTITVSQYFLCRDGSPDIMSIPVLAFLIRHPKGDVLFDTGLGLTFAGDGSDVSPAERQLMSELGAINSTATVGTNEDVGSRLEASDVDPAKIRYLINSHLHFDHCGGNALIPNAQLVLQKREWAAASTAEGRAANHYHPHEFDLGHDRFEVDGKHDLFGDGSIVCIPSYGHTPGHQSIRIRLPDGEVVLTADACALCRALDRMAPPGAAPESSHDAILESYRMFNKLDNSGVGLIFGHDPQQWNLLDKGTPTTQVTAGAVTAAKRAMGR